MESHTLLIAVLGSARGCCGLGRGGRLCIRFAEQIIGSGVDSPCDGDLPDSEDYRVSRRRCPVNGPNRSENAVLQQENSRHCGGGAGWQLQDRLRERKSVKPLKIS